MTAIILALLIGIVCGALKFLPKQITDRASKFTMMGVVALIGSMGAKIGLDPKLMANFALFGGQALVLALCAVGGSVLVVVFFERWLFGEVANSQENVQEQELAQMIHLEESAHQQLSNALTYYIIGSLLLGTAAGYWFLPHDVEPYLDTITAWALYFMIWAVGLDLGKSGETLRKVLAVGWKVLLVPLGVVLGSLLGSVLGGTLLGFPINESSAIGAGFGWYSLSGVLLAQIYSVKIGAIAFLSNVFRELIAVMTIPFLAKKIGPLAAVAPGGATTMDTTLPLIAAAAGNHTALIGFVSGLTLSSVVPFLIPILIKL
ncbi:MAG TPA: lysine exporter LysO family protein [Candidatus Deferrimicrobium sp.]|nr:lysine exporter LysO family protein [Candidatus Deferrimicrobium sp.]